MARPLSARCIRTLVEKAADSAKLNEDSNHSDHRINKKATNQTESISARLGFTTLSEVSGLAFEVSPRQKELHSKTLAFGRQLENSEYLGRLEPLLQKVLI